MRKARSSVFSVRPIVGPRRKCLASVDGDLHVALLLRLIERLEQILLALEAAVRHVAADDVRHVLRVVRVHAVERDVGRLPLVAIVQTAVQFETVLLHIHVVLQPYALLHALLVPDHSRCSMQTVDHFLDGVLLNLHLL